MHLSLIHIFSREPLAFQGKILFLCTAFVYRLIMSLIIIELENMEFHACHGCYPLEQVVGNRFLVDVKIEADLSKAAASDNVADTINYLNVFETVREMCIRDSMQTGQLFW